MGSLPVTDSVKATEMLEIRWAVWVSLSQSGHITVIWSGLVYPGGVWSVLWPHEDGDPHLRLLPLLGGEHGHPVEEGLHHGRLGDHQGQRDGREETLRPRSVSIISRLSTLTSHHIYSFRLWETGRPQWGQEEDCKCSCLPGRRSSLINLIFQTHTVCMCNSTLCNERNSGWALSVPLGVKIILTVSLALGLNNIYWNCNSIKLTSFIINWTLCSKYKE